MCACSQHHKDMPPLMETASVPCYVFSWCPQLEQKRSVGWTCLPQFEQKFTLSSPVPVFPLISGGGASNPEPTGSGTAGMEADDGA